MNDKALQSSEYRPSASLGRLSLLAVLAIAALYYIRYNSLRSWMVKAPITWDQSDYYAYLPTFLIYGDADLAIVKQDKELYGERFKHFISAKGKPVFRMTMGVALMNVPFFLAGHTWALNSDFPADGYSPPYYKMMWLSGIVYSLLGLLLLRKLLLQHFNDRVVALTLITVGAATNLMNYATYDALMSHAISFFLALLFMHFTVAFHKKESVLNMLALGLVWGMITLIRPTNCLILFFFVLYDVQSFSALAGKVKRLLGSPRFLLLFGVLALLVFLPQLLYWHRQTGNWLFYSYGEKGSFFFLRPRIADGLFSYRKGWLLYTPVMILALTGIPLLYKKYKQFFASVAVTFILAVYVMFSFWCWWYGGSFGCRPIIEYYGLLAIPMAAVFAAVSSKKILQSMLVLFVAGCIWLNIKQQKLYRDGLIHWDSMSEEFYWDVMLGRSLDTSKLDVPDYEQGALTGEE
ncbi:MAG: hypothetical protein WC150_12635 [Bacteroidia bacterium]